MKWKLEEISTDLTGLVDFFDLLIETHLPLNSLPQDECGSLLPD